MMPADICGKNILGRGRTSKCKDSEVDLCIDRSVKSQVTGTEYGRQSLVGDPMEGCWEPAEK